MSDGVAARLASWPSRTSELHWSLRASFTDYVRSIDDGRVQTEDVELDQSSRFIFRESDRREPQTFLYRGMIHFWAHYGVLNFRLAELEVHLADDARVTIAAQPRERARATIARLLPISDDADFVLLDARVTDDGVRLLGSVYSVGDSLDPLLIVRRREPGDAQ